LFLASRKQDRLPITLELNGYRIKSFLTEIRFPAQFRINSELWKIIENFPPETIAPLQSGGITAQNKLESSEYTVEFNRIYFLVENIENIAQLDGWMLRATKLLNQAINQWQMPVIDRLGIRFHLMPVDGAEHTHDYYAQMLADGVDIIKSGVITDKVASSGFVFRMQLNEWGVRFGSFSSDASVMKKYHKFHLADDSVFYKPGIVYDIDCFQQAIKTGHGDVAQQGKTKFDISSYVKSAHMLSSELVKKHLQRMQPSTV
jgi:hypothetical protein